jgi:hypothetical protein
VTESGVVVQPTFKDVGHHTLCWALDVPCIAMTSESEWFQMEPLVGCGEGDAVESPL